MKIKTAVFETSSPELKGCPPPGVPEIALIGRSNVGKSSLINMITERRDLAKVSGTPGKTRLINFFVINDDWRLVDLPGYGYAKVSMEMSADFSQAVARYLEKRDSLRCTLVLIDSMLDPQPIDLQFLRWLADTDVHHMLVFTKTDRQSPTATRKKMEQFVQVLGELGLPVPTMIACSAKKSEGRRELLQAIAKELE